MKRIRKWMLAKRLNFFLVNVALSIAICYVVSLTPFSLKGFYIPFIIGEIISINALYDYLIKKGRKDIKIGKSTAHEHARQ